MSFLPVRKDGEVGGVFSNLSTVRKSDLGSLEKFRSCSISGTTKEPAPVVKKSEQIDIAKLDDIDEAFVCIVNYGAAIEGDDVTYAEEGGRIEVKSDSGDYLEVLADSSDEGHVYCVCSIKNKGGEFALKNESRVMSLGKAFDEIGFALICED